jgi:hypothetical protein
MHLNPMRLQHLILLLSLAGCAGVTPPDTFTPMGTVPCANPESGRVPAVTTTAEGLHILSWIESDGEDHVLYVAHVDLGQWSQPLEVVRHPNLLVNWADFPTVSVADDGTWMIAWLLRTPDAGGYGVQFALSYDWGRSWSEARSLHDDASGAEHGFVSLAPIGASSFLAIWLDGRHAGAHGHEAGAYVLLSRQVDRDGTLGPEVLVDDQVCSCCQTDLVRDEDDTHVAVYRDCSGQNVRDIAWVHRTAAGWSAPKVLYEDDWVIPGCPVNGPRASAGAVAWYTGVGPAGGEVRVVEFRAEEGALFEPLDVDDGVPLGRVDMLTLENGTRLVTWLENVGDGEAEWRARPLWPNGDLGPSTVIDRVPATREIGFLRGTADGAGAHLVWHVPGVGVRTGYWMDPR